MDAEERRGALAVRSCGCVDGSRRTGKQFEIVDAELRRAKAKSFVKGIKPLRGLRRNQEAVNESTLAAVRELVVVNRKMACEIEALQNLALVLRQQIVELQSRPEWLLIREASEKRSQT